MEQRVPMVSQRRPPVGVAVQQLLDQAVAAVLQSRAEAVTGATTHFVEALHSHLNEELRGTAPRGTDDDA